YRKKHGFNPFSNWRLHNRLLAECERAKLALSRSLSYELPVVVSGKRESFKITRDRFEGVTRHLLQQTRDLTEFLLDNAGVDPEELDVILPVGGAAAMPAVRRMLTEFFGARATPDHAARKAFPDPRTAVAEGAAVYAAMLRAKEGANQQGPQPDAPKRIRKRLRAIELEEVSAHSVGVVIDDPASPGRPLNHVVIARGVRLPTAVQMPFGTTPENAKGIRLKLVEGERPEAADCDRMGEYRITGLPEETRVGTPVTVNISLDDRNAPHVAAHQVVNAADAIGAGASHDLRPLRVEAIVPQPGSQEEIETSGRLARLMPHPR
ncbi:MAG: Hsp70 family protein, partial [Planctomycetota bacterium]